MGRNLKPGESIQAHSDIALPSNPKPRQASSIGISDFGYYEGTLCEADDARRELGTIKGEIENLIFWKRTGQNQNWWGAEQDHTAARHDAKWRKALVDWKLKFAALDVEKILREVFTSKVGRVWEQDPTVKVLAREWAGVEEVSK
jgi:hypothetical protein